MRRKTFSALMASVTATAMFASSGAAAGTVLYDAVTVPLPSNVTSLGYEATQTSEFGQALTLASAGTLDSVTVTMSSWACQTGQWQNGDCLTVPNGDGSLPTFNHPITINLYKPGTGNLDDGPGALIGSVTQTIAVPFRPSVNATCPSTNAAGTTGYRRTDDPTRCTDGYAFNATFNFPGLALPANVVVGVAYSTAGDVPADALNVGLTTAEPTTGTAGDVYWNSTYAGRTPGFTDDGDWGYNVMIRLETAPLAPVTADDCKNGGFKGYGFSNQGQCVASVKANVNAGK